MSLSRRDNRLSWFKFAIIFGLMPLFGPSSAWATHRFPKMVMLNGGDAWTPSQNDCYENCQSSNGETVEVCPGAEIEVSYKVQVLGVNWKGTSWNVESTTSGCDNFEPDHTTDGTYTETFTVTAPNSPGTYDFTVHARSSDDCSSGSSGKITLANAIRVKATSAEVCDDIDNDCDGDIDEGLNCDGNPCAGTLDACIYIMVDRTGSTSAASRLSEAAAGKVALEFFDGVVNPPPIAIGVFGCNGSGFPGGQACTRQALSNTESPAPYGDNDANSDGDHFAFLDQGAASASSVGTHFLSALNVAGGELDHCNRANRILLFLSDGGNSDDATATLNAANALKADGVEIFTILFPGSSNPSLGDVNEMRSIATDAEHFFQSPTANNLMEIFEDILNVISCDDQNPCTSDVCDPLSGCVHSPVDCPGDECEGNSCDVCSAATSGNGGIVEFKLVSAVFDGMKTTFTYSVCQDHASPDAEHVVIGVPALCCADLAPPKKCVSDAVTGLPGVKFEFPGGLPDCGVNCGVPGTSISFQIVGNFETGCTAAAMKVDGINAIGRTCVAGPSCEVCLPDCADRMCGDDGCGGTCGSCEDSNACTADSCSAAGVCVHGPVDCNDHNACTSDACDLLNGCTHSAVTCNDNNACTTDSCNPATGCEFTTITCNDNNSCTVDTCDAATGCKFTAVGCDDGNACTNDSCTPTGGCTHTPVACNDNNLCTNDTCTPSTGCVFTPITCNDSNKCTTNSCDPLTGCVFPTIACDDQNACTSDSCIPATGCVFTPITCNDNSLCTNDSCHPVNGCVFTPIACNDNSACTTDTCNPTSGCVFTPLTCNDNSACTTDTCDPTSGCVFTPIACDDGSKCTNNSCDPQTGCVFPPITCNDNSACTIDTCNPATGCDFTPIPCNDLSACTADSCNPASGCVFTPIPCNDNNACTGDSCNPQSGCVFTPIPCNDGNSCTNDTCNPQTGCVFSPMVCDDASACTADTCDPATGCVFTPIVCDDNTVCTEDSCDPLSGCRFLAVGCDDQNACTNDTCTPTGGCLHTPITCNDNSVCTNDSCNPVTGCVFTPVVCNDNNACTSNECNPQTGCVFPPIVCNDGSACTTDSCLPLVGCVFTPITCNDNSVCTVNGCDPASGCVFNPITCNDNNACTSDSCHPILGCVFTPTSCDDQDACTTDGCNPSTGCTHSLVTCNDNNACTADDCRPESGCVFTATPCDDGNACTEDSCQPIKGCMYTPIVCNDGLPCTSDFCNPETGCQYSEVPGPCDDGDPCTIKDMCNGSDCVGEPAPNCGCTGQDLFADTEFTFVGADLDLRQDTNGPVTTKLKFDVWNQNETRFSGTERCMTCWDSSLLRFYDAPNHFLVWNLQTNQGKTRVEGLGSTVCTGSVSAGVFGVIIKEITCPGVGVQMRSANPFHGVGGRSAQVLYDVESDVPDDSVVGMAPGGAGPGAAFTQLAEVLEEDVADVGPSAAPGPDDNRGSTDEKGSLLYWPKVQVRWNEDGLVIEDTFLTVVNDTSEDVIVQMYFVNGDKPLPPMFVGDPPVLVERAHPGWNNSDIQFVLTANESTYWSAATGLPKAVTPWSALDPPLGRPDLDPLNMRGRVLRGFVVGWAVNVNGEEVRWNHLSGTGLLMNYVNATAAEYETFAFQCVSGVPQGEACDAVPGRLLLDGFEYDAVPNQLISAFQATGSRAYSILPNP